MQLVTHPIDTVKQCVAAGIQLNRLAHSNEDCRGKNNKHLNCTSASTAHKVSLFLRRETHWEPTGLLLWCPTTSKTGWDGSCRWAVSICTTAATDMACRHPRKHFCRILWRQRAMRYLSVIISYLHKVSPNWPFSCIIRVLLQTARVIKQALKTTSKQTTARASKAHFRGEARYSLIPDELWITLHLQNAFVKFSTLEHIASVLPSLLHR